MRQTCAWYVVSPLLIVLTNGHVRMATFTYRVSAFQPISIALAAKKSVFKLKIRKEDCSFSLKPVHSRESKRLKNGGTHITVEFTKALEGDDIVVAAREGIDMIEDFQSALSLVSGVPLRGVRLLQVAKFDLLEERCEFLQFLDIDPLHWPRDITDSDLNNALSILAHWDGLDKGNRLRRGARRYRDAIGNVHDDVSAYQDAYAGLEALEPILAPLYGLESGVETVETTCPHCKKAYSYKRTSLVGVRAFVLGSTDAQGAEEGRRADWKAMNSLRHNIVHSLKDDEEIEGVARRSLMAAMHYLHDAVCIGSHSVDMASNEYRVARAPIPHAIHGVYDLHALPDLPKWGSVLTLKDVEWVPHATMKFVPQTRLKAIGLKNVRMRFVRLKGDLSDATEESLEVAETERD